MAKKNAYGTKKNTTDIYQKEEARALHQSISHGFISMTSLPTVSCRG